MKSKEIIIKYTEIICLCLLLIASEFFQIKVLLSGNFDFVDSLHIYVDFFGIWEADDFHLIGV